MTHASLEDGLPGATTVSFLPRLIASDGFMDLFGEGMRLVEDTAAYLDGDGRTDARALGKAEAVAFASESMRLTTNLMQCASWLLLQRAVRSGETPPETASSEARAVRFSSTFRLVSSETAASLPVRLLDLVERAARVRERILTVAEPREGGEAPQGGVGGPVAERIAMLRTALASE